MTGTEPLPSSLEQARTKFPGDELVAAGLADLAAGRRSAEALLLAAAEHRGALTDSRLVGGGQRSPSPTRNQDSTKVSDCAAELSVPLNA
jgi:hypothetical protein